MKKISIVLILSIVLAFSACKKNDTTIPANALPLTFSGISKTQDTVQVNVYDTLVANASGEGITFTWASENGLGTFIPTDKNNTVLFAGCHATDFVIDCQAKDKYDRTDAKKITIHVIN